ncbi:MAG: histidinol-phosphatase [Halocynthiibacter sp.]
MQRSKTIEDDIRATAHALADAARAAILPFFRGQDLGIENKIVGDFDPVTKGDRAAETAMREILAKRRPEDAILGEEFGQKSGTTGLTWVLDPIDGTRGFMSGTPTWGVLISVADETGPFYGLIDQPYTQERFEGGLGQAMMVGPHGDVALKARATDQLSEAILFTTFPEVGSAEDRAGFETVRDEVRLTRYGMDCYAYALLALGQIDLVIEAGLQAYDIQAPIAVIEAAGGIVTDWTGAPAHEGGRVLAAANAVIHRKALALLAPYV